MKPSSSTSDRRDSGRSSERARIVLRIPEQELEGTVQNLSEGGVLLHSEGSLRIEVEIESSGESRKLEGRLVRCERVDDRSQGWAIQF